MTNILKSIKEEIKGYKDYWDLPKHLKIKLEKETFDHIKKGEFGKIGEKTLLSRVEAVKKEYANEHPKYRSNIKQD